MRVVWWTNVRWSGVDLIINSDVCVCVLVNDDRLLSSQVEKATCRGCRLMGGECAGYYVYHVILFM